MKHKLKFYTFKVKYIQKFIKNARKSRYERL